MNNQPGNQALPGEALTDMDKFWLDTTRGAVKESIGALEEAAKQLISVASLLQGIYFAAVSFSDLKKAIVVGSCQGWFLVILFVGPLIPWLASVALAMQVFKPETYKTNLRSPELAQQTYEGMVAYKRRYLRYAHWALLVGFVLLVINIVVYLGFIPPALS